MSESNPGSDLAGSFEDALPVVPKVPSNWGVAGNSRPLLPRRWFVVVAVLVVFMVAPVVFLSLRPKAAPVRDGAYRALDAYVQAKVTETPLEEGLSAQQRALLSSASRVESSDEVLLTLRSDSVCWSVPLEPQDPAPTPQEVVPELCP